MSKFIIKTMAYANSPVFDIHVTGHNLTAVEFGEETSRMGLKKVYTFETKDDLPLDITIKKVRGDVEIHLPEGWDCSADIWGTNDFGRRLPRVTVYQDDTGAILGYVASEKMELKFYKVAETVQVEVQR